jgi:integrase
MVQQLHKLTELFCRRAATPGYYGDGGGLYLRVGPAGTKSWVFRYEVAGKAREMGLGALHTHTLREARELARQCRQKRYQGIDPIDERKARQARAKTASATARTFRHCAEAYVKANEAGWRNTKHRSDWVASLGTHVFPVIGDMPVGAIDTAAVLKVLSPIWTQIPETASRVRGRLELVLDWAKAHKYRDGADNPARWKGNLQGVLPRKDKVRSVEHYAALPYAEIPALVGEVSVDPGIPAQALLFTILTCGRTNEVLGAKWDEFDLAKQVWLVPAERMKAHRVALNSAALAIFPKLFANRHSEFVFAGQYGRPLSARTMLDTLKRLRPGTTVHGLRSSFRDWAAECTGFPAEIAEMALAHTVSGAVERAYKRTDLLERRRQLSETWGAFCTGSAGTGNIVTLPVAATAVSG